MTSFKYKILSTGTAMALLTGVPFLAAATYPASAFARSDATGSPLIISNEPLPPALQNRIYSKPSRAPVITPAQITGPAYYGDDTETVVGRKVTELRNELFSLQGSVSELSEALASIEATGQRQAAEYYASVATISTQLQSGTTPGNPRLIQKLGIARENLEELSANIASLNDLAVQISNAASMASYLLESARATYGLTGAIEEDHVRLAQLEDAVNSTVVVIERLLNNVNDDITRTVAYLSAERENLRTMSLAINTGDLFGKSLSNRPFTSQAQPASFVPGHDSATISNGIYNNGSAAYGTKAGVPDGPRPLVKIRFDRADVAYEQPVYMAINEALSRYPNARFELIAVHPSIGNAAEVAIESTRSRRNAEKVLRSLNEMGLDLDRIDLSYAPNENVTTSEVHLYVH